MAQENEPKHWADKIALEVSRRINEDPKLKEISEKHGVIIYDEKTPSGTIHIGSGRGWVIHDVIAKSLRDMGIKARFILSSDDMDPYDKPNKELDSSWDKYLGMPFCDIPSPVEGYDNFGDYYFKQVTEKFPDFGIECELESTAEAYKKGEFNPMIKLILDNYTKVQQIYTDLYGETGGSSKIPFNVKCPKCGKIATTLATAWDSEKELLSFECRDDTVSWAKGCGEKGEISPYDGNGKFPWKVEWAAKWPTKSVIVEYAGKDHFTKGGSRTFACKLATELLKYPSPYPSDGYSIGKGYEFFTIGGAKMSTSKGKGLGFRDASDIAPTKILRYLLVKSRPNAVIDFDPFQGNDMILLFDRYDKCERVYFGETEGMSENDIENQKRIYELSHIGKIPEKLPLQVPLSFASLVIQVAVNDVLKAIEILKKTGHIPKEAHNSELISVKERLTFAKKWLDHYADDSHKFEVVDKVRADILISPKLKELYHDLIDSLKSNIYDEKTLFEEFYNLCKKHDVQNTEFFKTTYSIIINKERGPKLAAFILAIGKDKVVDLLEQVV